MKLMYPYLMVLFSGIIFRHFDINVLYFRSFSFARFKVFAKRFDINCKRMFIIPLYLTINFCLSSPTTQSRWRKELIPV